MPFPENLTMPPLSDCQFYHENLPSISVVHSHMAQAAQVSPHTNSASPLPSPLHQLHHPQVGGQQSHVYTLRSNSHGSLEPNKFGFKHNQGSSLQGQNHSQSNFSPQRRFVPQGHNTAPGLRNQQQYNRNTWRRRKRGSLPALNQSRWKTEATWLNLTGVGFLKASLCPLIVSVLSCKWFTMHLFLRLSNMHLFFFMEFASQLK